MNKYTKQIELLYSRTIDAAQNQLEKEGVVAIGLVNALEVLDRIYALDERNSAKPKKTVQYKLSYKKLNGDQRQYKILEIEEMDNLHLRAVVDGKGYRTFILSRIEKLTPIS